MDFSTDSEAVPPNEVFNKFWSPVKYKNIANCITNHRMTNGNPVLSFLLCFFIIVIKVLILNLF